MPFTLHFRVDLLFGGVFALIALYMLPAPAGILAAVIIASPTFYLWNHVLGIIMYTMEALFIVILIKKTRLHLLVCATITWFFLLPPLIFFNMQMSGMFFPSAIRLFILKYMINGVFNAAAATALIFLLKLKVTDQQKTDIEIRASEAAINVFIIVTVIPLLIFTLLDSRILSDSVFSQVQSRHDTLKKSISLLIKQWHDQHVSTIRQIADNATISGNNADLMISIEAFCLAQPGFQYIYVADAQGKCLACYPNRNKDSESCTGLDFSKSAQFKTIMDTGKPLVSGITTEDTLLPDQVIVIAEPAFRDGKLVGFAGGALNPLSLEAQIQPMVDNKVRLRILDDSNRIVYDQNKTMIGQTHENHLDRAISVMSGKLTIIPPVEKMAAATSYRNSTIILEASLASPLNWSLTIEEPMAEYVENLFELSFRQFLNISVLTLFLVMLSGLIRKYFTVPLQELSHYTSEIAKSGFASINDPAPTSSVFEIKQLIQNFSAALEKIVAAQNLEKEKNQQLQAANNTLQEKIAQLKKSQDAVEQAENSFSTLVNNSPFAIVLADRTGSIEFANEEFSRHTSLTGQKGLNLGDLFAKFIPFGRMGFPVSSFLDRLSSTQNNSKHIDAGELCLQKGSERRIFNCVATTIETRCIVIFSDITDSAIAEEEKVRLAEKLQIAQKFESLGTLAGGVAHDFNNILMSIMGYAEISLSDLPKSGRLYENICMIQTAAQRAAELTRQMLDFTGKNVFNIEPLDLSVLVKEMATLVSVTISKKIAINYDLKEGITALGDQSQLRQIVLNLVMNASEAIGDKNGQITIRTGNADRNSSHIKSATMSDLDPGNDLHVFFEVSDTGCGIGPDTLKKIFDPFFPTKFTGRGLGLA
ncbi:MAG: PAS/PAC sensor hybrid histidine kinase, partial [uncultured bacterium]